MKPPTIAVVGHIEVKNGIRIITNIDLCRFYRSLISKRYPSLKTQLPKHGAHVTLCSPKVHGISNFNLARYLHGKKTTFEYSPLEIYKSRVNFWLPVYNCPVYKEVKKLFRVKEKEGWLGLHLTICNTKFN